MRSIWIFLCLVFFGLNAQESPWHHDFIVVTPEKCGTHLLMKTMEKMLNKCPLACWKDHMPIDWVRRTLDEAKRTNRFFHMHAIPYKDLIALLKEKNYKVIFLIRDPRDQAVSLLHFIDAGWGYYKLCPDLPYGRLSRDDKLLEIINGKRYGISAIQHIMGRKLGWMYFPSQFVYTVRFENLVGEEGGGSREKQLMEIYNIAEFLGVQLSEKELQERSRGLFGKPGDKTFRSGQIGEWKKYFKSSHKATFKTVFGAELIEMDYENNLKW